MTGLLLRILKKPILVPKLRNFHLNSSFLATSRLLPVAVISSKLKIKQCAHYSLITPQRLFSTELSNHEFGELCEKTLDSLADYFDELVESLPVLKNGDVAYSDGVITAYLGDNLGTYVINRQTPNQQIWLSSPTSGPKRYDFIDNVWVYKHDNSTLHSLLDKELVEALKCPVDFSSNCLFGKKN